MSWLQNTLIPARVGVGLMILGGAFGWLVGVGSSPWFLAVLPFLAWGFIAANKLDGEVCKYRYGNVCPACAEPTDAEVAALREYFRMRGNQ